LSEIAAELLNMILNPLQSKSLIKKASISLNALAG